MSETLRVCTKCKIPKELQEFTFVNKRLGLLHTLCKECKYYPIPNDGSTNRQCSDCKKVGHYKDDFPPANSSCKECHSNRQKILKQKRDNMDPVYEDEDDGDLLFMKQICYIRHGDEPHISNYKVCECCNILIPLEKYCVNQGRPDKTCKSCSTKLKSERMHDPNAFLKYKYDTAKSRAKSKCIDFTITLEQWNYIYFVKQRGKCNLTGQGMTHFLSPNREKDEDFPDNISPDRKDSKKGYTFENVQFVRWIANCGKNKYDQNVFINMCGEVWNNHIHPVSQWNP